MLRKTRSSIRKTRKISLSLQFRRSSLLNSIKKKLLVKNRILVMMMLQRVSNQPHSTKEHLFLTNLLKMVPDSEQREHSIMVGRQTDDQFPLEINLA